MACCWRAVGRSRRLPQAISLRGGTLQRALCSSALENGSELQVTRLEGDKAGVVRLELNRPKANALSRSLVSGLLSALAELEADLSVRAVVLSSRVPGVFCAGADLKERAGMPTEEVGPFVASLRGLMSRVARFPAPIIAAVEGAAFGGGLELMLACDLRVAGAGATMGLTETGLGIIPGAGGTQRLPRLIGVAAAKEMVFLGQRVGATRALELGLVNRSVGQGGALAEALDMAGTISTKAPLAVRLAKAAIDRGLQADIGTGLAVEEAMYQQVVQTKDRLEGLRAFAEKRAPCFTGE